MDNSNDNNTSSQMWIKKSSLLKTFSKGLIEFFQDIAHIDIEAHLSEHVDIVQIAKNDELNGKVELMKLLLVREDEDKIFSIVYKTVVSSVLTPEINVLLGLVFLYR